MRYGWLIALALLTSACSGGSDGDDDTSTARVEDTGGADTSHSDVVTDTGASDMDTDEGDIADEDTAEPDTAPQDVAPDVVHGDTGPYGACSSDADCQAGLECVERAREAEYGQCVAPCTGDGATCDDGGTGEPAICDDGYCLAQCGDGGVCPEGLACHDISNCVEPSLASVGPAGSCATGAECAEDTYCISGESTQPHCAILCESDADCTAVSPGGQCMAAGGLQFCWFMCGAMASGAECPGDLVCDTVVCI